jgi:hypothetical protein
MKERRKEELEKKTQNEARRQSKIKNSIVR